MRYGNDWKLGSHPVNACRAVILDFRYRKGRGSLDFLTGVKLLYDIRTTQELLGQRRGDDDDLYSRPNSGGKRLQESTARTLNRADSGLYGSA